MSPEATAFGIVAIGVLVVLVVVAITLWFTR